MKVCMLDIEATNLAADFGRVLCVCIKPLGEKVITISQSQWPEDLEKRPWDDSKVVKETFRLLQGFDVVVTYYGKRYDMPFLRTRSLQTKRARPYLFHIDLFDWVKHGLRMSRRSLLRIQEHLSLKSKKTPLTPDVWQRATAGDIRAYREIEEHCKMDVTVLEDVYRKALPNLKTLSRVVV